MHDQTSTRIGIAVVITAVITMALIVQQQAGIGNLRTAISAIVLIATAFWWQSKNQVREPSFRVATVWPVALILVWNSFFALIEKWGTYVTEPSFTLSTGYPELSDPTVVSWYASSWVFALVALQIFCVGYWFSILRFRLN